MESTVSAYVPFYSIDLILVELYTGICREMEKDNETKP